MIMINGSEPVALSHTIEEIDHEIISTAILLIQKWLMSVTNYWLTSWPSLPRKKCAWVN